MLVGGKQEWQDRFESLPSESLLFCWGSKKLLDPDTSIYIEFLGNDLKPDSVFLYFLLWTLWVPLYTHIHVWLTRIFYQFSIFFQYSIYSSSKTYKTCSQLTAFAICSALCLQRCPHRSSHCHSFPFRFQSRVSSSLAAPGTVVFCRLLPPQPTTSSTLSHCSFLFSS